MRLGKIFLWLLLLPAVNLAAASSFSALAGMGYLSDFAGGSTTSFPSSARIQQGVNDESCRIPLPVLILTAVK